MHQGAEVGEQVRHPPLQFAGGRPDPVGVVGALHQAPHPQAQHHDALLDTVVQIPGDPAPFGVGRLHEPKLRLPQRDRALLQVEQRGPQHGDDAVMVNGQAR